MVQADAFERRERTSRSARSIRRARCAHSRRWIRYDERVCTYWPEFAQNGKERITIRQLLANQAGLFAFDEPVNRAVIADLDRLAAVMVRQRPDRGVAPGGCGPT